MAFSSELKAFLQQQMYTCVYLSNYIITILGIITDCDSRVGQGLEILRDRESPGLVGVVNLAQSISGLSVSGGVKMSS